jgi:F0F1-type ATP synthase assembly protein I
MLLLATALDTTWRAFVPTIGGVFLGIGIDHWLGVTPIATIICLILGTAASIGLIARQLISVRGGK